jgi:uncharacterized protein
MRIIRHSELQQSPWKNGGGVTREIAVKRTGDTLIWRLSVAEVCADGPFSRFVGLKRILTVIEGHGMELKSQSQTLKADYAVPVRFDGDWVIESKLNNGPLRDLNLIYDPAYCEGDVVVVDIGVSKLHATQRQIYAVHCFAGEVELDNSDSLKVGDTALLETGSLQLTIEEGDSALLITLTFPS